MWGIWGKRLKVSQTGLNNEIDLQKHPNGIVANSQLKALLV
jgi:hypothetical protein